MLDNLMYILVNGVNYIVKMSWKVDIKNIIFVCFYYCRYALLLHE